MDHVATVALVDIKTKKRRDPTLTHLPPLNKLDLALNELDSVAEL